MNVSSPRAQSESWSAPITDPEKTEDHPALACAARLHADAIAVRGERWVTITSASGYTVSSASSANRWLGFFSTHRWPASGSPMSCRFRLWRS